MGEAIGSSRRGVEFQLIGGGGVEFSFNSTELLDTAPLRNTWILFTIHVYIYIYIDKALHRLYPCYRPLL